MWTNAFPVSAGVSATISPRILVTGVRIDYLKNCRCPFGAYVHTHKKSDSTDTPRTVGAICLGPTCNIQGTYTFMNLSTGRRIYRKKWDELNTPEHVIKRVATLAKRDKARK